jgi:hypothetical protein
MPNDPKPEPKYTGEAAAALDEVRRFTAIIEAGQQAFRDRVDAYARCRAADVLFSDIAEAAHCTDSAVMTALKKAGAAR